MYKYAEQVNNIAVSQHIAHCNIHCRLRQQTHLETSKCCEITVILDLLFIAILDKLKVLFVK